MRLHNLSHFKCTHTNRNYQYCVSPEEFPSQCIIRRPIREWEPSPENPPFLCTSERGDTSDTSDTSDTNDTNDTNLIGTPLVVSPDRFVSQKCSDTPRGCQAPTAKFKLD